jgi:hypothetical protein
MEDPASSLPNHNSDPSPQIQQNVEGDGNQVIGQVTGGNVFGNITGNVTIYDRVPVSSMPPPISVMPTLTQQEYRQRQVLLDKVQKFWVKGVLENSLHSRALIELGLEERLDLVKQPFSGVGEFLDVPGQVLPDGTQSTAVFDEMGEGRTLLILGEPGAGKTIALLKLAEDLIVRTTPDLRQQIPVVFNLSSWARKPQAIEKWLVQELLEKYQVSKALGETWVKSEALILLLDGLDEVQADQRNACVQALNLFMQNHGTTEVLVCCRIRDYQVLNNRLTLRSAICIQPLTSQQVNSYFDRAGEQLSALKIILPQDEVLQELATSPLMLSIMSLAYQDFTPEQLTLGGKAEDYRKRLFATYVDRMFDRRGAIQIYSRKEAQKWLIWLSQRMTVAAQSVFLIEKLQPGWLPTRTQKISHYIGSCLIFGLLIELPYSVKYLSTITFSNIFTVFNGLLYSTIFYGLFYGFISVFFGEIKPVGSFKWSWHSAKTGFFYGLMLSLIFTLMIFIFYFWMIQQDSFYSNIISSSSMNSERILDLKKFNQYLIGSWRDYWWLLITLILLFWSMPNGCLWGVVCGFRGIEIQKGEKPNQGIFRSAKIATLFLILGMVCGIGFAKIIVFIDLPLFGSICGLVYGGNACIRHFTLRLILYLNGYTPWNYTRFLDYATERLFLRKVGGGYIFVHRMLLEHFAEMSPEQEDR